MLCLFADSCVIAPSFKSCFCSERIAFSDTQISFPPLHGICDVLYAVNLVTQTQKHFLCTTQMLSAGYQIGRAPEALEWLRKVGYYSVVLCAIWPPCCFTSVASSLCRCVCLFVHLAIVPPAVGVMGMRVDVSENGRLCLRRWWIFISRGIYF